MGIEGFTGTSHLSSGSLPPTKLRLLPEWFLQTFPQSASVIKGNAEPIYKDHVMVDMNQLIHLAARKAKDEEHLFVKIFSSLDKLFKVFTPIRSVFLVLDGPGMHMLVCCFLWF